MIESNAGDARPDVVLCIGDSCTHGTGSSDTAKFSYPAALQALLRERTQREWSVVNCGLTGQNSRDVLQRLPAQLAEFGPRVVCVTVGMNDFWTCPEVLPERSDAEPGDHREDRCRRRLPYFARGPEWAPRHVPSTYHNQPLKWHTTPESRAHKEEGWRRAATKDVREALAQFELAFAIVADDAQTRQMLFTLYHRNGRSEAAAPHLRWLIDSWSRDQDFVTGTSLVLAFEQCGRAQEAYDVAVQVLTKYAGDGLIWRCRAASEFHLGRFEEASQSIAEAIRLWPDRWSFYWRFRIQFRLGNIDDAIRTICDGYVVGNDADAATNDLRALASFVDGPRLQAVLAAFACEPDVRGRLAQIVEEVIASLDGSAATTVLLKHLRRIVRLVRGAGATPVFVPYHRKLPPEDVMRTVANELKAGFVSMSETFAQRLVPQHWADVQSQDGHCNDAGYRLMAAIVADALQELVATAFR